MRQFYLLAVMAAVCTVQVSAQSHATKLENNQVIYLTNDTVAFKTVTVEDDETGEQTTKVQETYWMGSNTNAAYKAVGLPISGTSSTKKNLPFRTRQDYTDPETGFSMPAGCYRGILVDGTTSLQNYDASENYVVGYQNVKAVKTFPAFPDKPHKIINAADISHIQFCPLFERIHPKMLKLIMIIQRIQRCDN